MCVYLVFFFFQAEDGIRDLYVTGVQTCALPISRDDLDGWRALQEDLADRPAAVSVPFAGRLAAMIPPVTVRLRRDFPAILGMIRAHALLEQQDRERDGRGRIVATVADY